MFTENDEAPDFDFGYMESLDQDQSNESINNIDLISVQNFRKLKTKAIEFYAHKYQIQMDQIGYIPSNLKVEQKITLTNQLLNDHNVQIIIDAHFSHIFQTNQQTYQYVADCFIFDKTSKKMVLLGYSSKSPLENFYKFFYLINTAKKEHEILDASLIIIDPVINQLRQTQAKEINFSESFSAHLSKSLPPSNIKLSCKENFYKQILARTGDGTLFLDSPYWNKRFYSFYGVAIKKELPITTFKVQELEHLPDDLNNYHNNKTKPDFKVIFSTGKNFKAIEFENIDWYYQLIARADEKYSNQSNYSDIAYFTQIDFSLKENKQILENFIQGSLIIPPVVLNVVFLPNLFIKNEEILALITYVFGIAQWTLSKTLFKSLGLKYQNYQHIQQTEQVASELINYFNIAILDVIKKIHIKDQRIIWYDYEGFSDLFPILKTSKSYEQIVSQVSIIETINGTETNKVNHVVDTKNITLQDLVQLILLIYANGADLFIVYNKTYENTRNKEIYNLVEQAIKNSSNEEFSNWFTEQNLDLTTFKAMIDHINLNTIDLYDCFKYRDLNRAYPHFCNDESLFTFKIKNNTIVPSNQVKELNPQLKYKTLIFLDQLMLQGSIKKVEKFITHNKLELKTLIIPYTELVIQKGTMAMNEAILRYHGYTGQSQWTCIKGELEKYCENDVRAMIMVYEFIMQAIRSVFPIIDQYEYQIAHQDFEYNIINKQLTISRNNNE
ncbi:UU173 family protein [Mycoplasma sp. 1578d]|uniref:UU173 family protein n=1 Tax=Mycoplasma sp. 1578d TaxID=2967299 RepID=UPI0035930494